ncbi:unnamed protein product, partial [marine sediment metagenome]
EVRGSEFKAISSPVLKPIINWGISASHPVELESKATIMLSPIIQAIVTIIPKAEDLSSTEKRIAMAINTTSTSRVRPSDAVK